MRRIKNYDNLIKEDLIISLLKSESNPLECNYMRYFNNSTSANTNDDKIKGKITDISIIPSRLGNIVSTNDKKKIKEEIYDHLVKLVNTLNKKEEYKHSDHDDLDTLE